MSIVIIDPLEKDQERMIEMFQRWGYPQVHVCASLEDARNALGFNHSTLRTVFDLELIVIDITQGEEFSQFVDQIRSLLFYQDIPILAMAEGSRGEKMPLAFAFGATDFISKPIEEFEMRSRVRSSLRLKHEIDRRKARERELLEATHQLTDLNQILTKMSLLDSLTGIPNRRCFDGNFEQEWKRAFRNGGNIALILCDIDYFKQYNDTYGHQRGDQCLQRIAQTLKTSVKRPGDLVTRYGGEEFAIILPHTNATQSAIICKNIREAILELGLEHAGSQVSPFVTISMGVAATEPAVSQASTDKLIEWADQALYLAKERGRDRFETYREGQKKPGAA